MADGVQSPLSKRTRRLGVPAAHPPSKGGRSGFDSRIKLLRYDLLVTPLFRSYWVLIHTSGCKPDAINCVVDGDGFDSYSTH